MWPIAQGDPIKPPLIRKISRQPKKKRKRAIEEKEKEKLGKLGLQMACYRRGIVGHSKKPCKNQGVKLVRIIKHNLCMPSFDNFNFF